MHAATYRLIPLLAKDGSVRARALVDADDYDWLNQWRWHLNDGYVVRHEYLGGGRAAPRSRTIRMHRQLLGLKPGDPREGDHINLRRHDNRRRNLRIVTRAQNRQNRRVHAGGTSTYRGVHWHAPTGRWVASARVAGRVRHLGYFDDEAEAGRVAAAWRHAHMPFATD